MATFPNIKPQYGETQTIEQDNIVVKLGDGYEQRLVRGLAANKRKVIGNFVFEVSQTDANTINTFLNARFDDQEAFDYTISGESASRKFKCTSRRASIPYLNRVTLNLTFEEVFEP